MVELASKGYLKPGYKIICNGFKNEKYVYSIKKLLDMGIDVVPVIENEQEFPLFKKLKGYRINFGCCIQI